MVELLWVSNQRTEISLVKEKRETVLLYFSFSMFGFWLRAAAVEFSSFPHSSDA